MKVDHTMDYRLFMSHFPVTVKLSAERLKKHDGSIRKALEEILGPYEESPEDEKYTEFVDVTDEQLAKYNTELIKQVRLDDGTYAWPYDEQFRVKGTFGIGSNTYNPPKDKVVNRKAEEIYGSFENYMSEYSGYKKNEEGRWGYWHNVSAKWDWWEIGGRWSGHFPLKPGAKRWSRDVVSACDIDMDKVSLQTLEQAEKFFDMYERMLKGETFDTFEGPREMALRTGLMTVEKKVIIAGPGEVVLPWSSVVRPDDCRSSWTDVCKLVTKEQFMERFAHCFNPIITYAYLDDEGWHSPGRIGLFGTSTDKPDDYVSFKKSFVQNVFESAKADDVLVCVDCHI